MSDEGARGDVRVSDEAALVAWLTARGLAPATLEALPGDVGPRRYFRLTTAGGSTAIVAVYPDDHREVCRRFLRTTALLARAGVRVPAVLAEECGRGVTVVEDLGAETLYDRAREGSGPAWSALVPFYESAAAAARRIAALSAAEVDGLSPRLDAALLRRELAQTMEVLLVPRDLAGDAAGVAAVERACDALCAALGAPPPVPCHRDLMARNLVPLAAGEVGVLDHQDLRLGPPFYDLASLLNDSLFPPPEVERAILAGTVESEEDRLRYRRAAAQRTLKAAGTFAAFARRGSERHTSLIPPTLKRALGHLAALPETADLAAELAPRWAALGIC